MTLQTKRRANSTTEDGKKKTKKEDGSGADDEEEDEGSNNNGKSGVSEFSYCSLFSLEAKELHVDFPRFSDKSCHFRFVLAILSDDSLRGFLSYLN